MQKLHSAPALIDQTEKVTQGTSDSSPIYWYEPDEEWGWMCSLSLHGFTLEGRFWPSAEHYYQAHKFPLDHPAFAEVAQAPTPIESKNTAHRHKANYLPGWHDTLIAYDTMKRAVQAKFAAHPDLATALVATHPRLIVEHSNDRRWGEGKDGSGENWAGKILMEIRNELRQTQP